MPHSIWSSELRDETDACEVSLLLSCPLVLNIQLIGHGAQSASSSRITSRADPHVRQGLILTPSGRRDRGVPCSCSPLVPDCSPPFAAGYGCYNAWIRVAQHAEEQVIFRSCTDNLGTLQDEKIARDRLTTPVSGSGDRYTLRIKSTCSR